jgi:ComF family protein
LRGAVIQGKYHGEWARIAELGPLLAEYCATLGPFDALVPVPLHASRLRRRGFNQSLLLAQSAAAVLGAPVEEALIRTRRTDAQARLNAEGRRANVRDAMAVAPGSGVSGRAFVVIDDVVTTGSTLAACAVALRRAGAVSVKAATFCREV